ncbi:TetR/AcrR family transcriptional regulator [Umezawaea sp. NPDC059074]|uniref:TetR/AcrR family transcriptional regulator n=1 Tax=Umezawaea sp. NPDC059074 TaxID=3346716 RepID=UPI0036D09C1B
MTRIRTTEATRFQRARSEEQRAERRRSILTAAAAMLDEMPVAAVTLNELARRVGLAKSNVMRYFESREAVLLDLLDTAAADFLVELTEALPAHLDQAATASRRAHETAAVLATSLAARPVLCELISTQAGVLEHNISTDVALKYKRGARDSLVGLAALLGRVLPELGEEAAVKASMTTIVLVGALWVHSRPAPAVLAAYDEDPTLAFMHPPFEATLESLIETLLIGLMAERLDD